MPRPHPREFAGLMLYPFFLGLAPVLGKMALNGNSDPFTLAAMRTVAAAAILWVVYLLFWRRYIFIYPSGLLGCMVVGTVNGIGSLFYYNGLNYLSASEAQLLNATYLIFVVVLSLASGHTLTRWTIIRATLAFIAVILITQGIDGQFSWLGAGLMIGNAILFAGTFMLGQRVVYEMPSQTVALYVITTMAIVVVAARLAYRQEWIPQSGEAVTAILALGFSTALSRLTMFFGIKKMGSIQTVLVGMTETAVSIVLAFLLLGEQLSLIQWAGVGVFLVSLLLIRRERLSRHEPMPSMAGLKLRHGISFNRIAFARAFVGHSITDTDDFTPEDLDRIRRMMEAKPHRDPSGVR